MCVAEGMQDLLSCLSDTFQWCDRNYIETKLALKAHAATEIFPSVKSANIYTVYSHLPKQWLPLNKESNTSQWHRLYNSHFHRIQIV